VASATRLTWPTPQPTSRIETNGAEPAELTVVLVERIVGHGMGLSLWRV
jgi:hypothetical protein